MTSISRSTGAPRVPVRPVDVRDPLALRDSDTSWKVEVTSMKPSRSGYLPINGLHLYHEVYGELGTSKPPLLLIPGAFMATDSMKAWADTFARERAVIVFDQQGHGRTPDTSRQMSYEQFAVPRRCCALWRWSARM
jgi:hypothetical protein